MGTAAQTTLSRGTLERGTLGQCTSCRGTFVGYAVMPAAFERLGFPAMGSLIAFVQPYNALPPAVAAAT